MIHEFALDPRILDRWEIYDRLVNDCGVEHGRLIAGFPKRDRWRKMVSEAVKANLAASPLDYTRIEFHLQHRVGAKFLPNSRRYDPADADWLRQAEREHDSGKPFRAIVSGENPRCHSQVIVASELDRDSDPRWKAARSISIPRTPDKLAELASPLFRISNEVRLIDPYFSPDAGRYRRSLKAILRALASLNPNIKKLEWHLEDKCPRDFFEQQCLNRLPSCVPRGISVQFFRWKERPDGERLHARMILTNRGGVGVEGGLDAGDDSQTTDAYLLTPELRDKHWMSFDHECPPGSDSNWQPTFQPETQGPVTVCGNAA